MIILGLGSNVGDRLHYLRAALAAIKKISGVTVHQVSPVYISDAQLTEHAPPAWNQPFLNFALACESTLSPQALFATLKNIEHALGREKEYERWSPRIVDIDIITWHDERLTTETLTLPHPRMLDRPFVLWPLADLMPCWQHPERQLTAEQLVEPWGSRFGVVAPYRTRQINQRVDTPRLVGIINVTPDSFADGGKCATTEQAFHHAVHLMEAGAEILDIGAESTAPNSHRIDTEVEWQRLEPVLAALKLAKNTFIVPPRISVDTMHAETARRALAYDVDWINDVTGFTDPAMRAAVRDSSVDCVAMHYCTIPPRPDHVLPRNQDPVGFLLRWSEQQIAVLENDGIDRQRIILDPGIGFGKTPGQAMAIFQHIHRFNDLGVRLLVGHSRKVFIKIFTSHAAPERDIETVTISQFLARQPVDYLRLHNVELCARAFRVQAALMPSPRPPCKTIQT